MSSASWPPPSRGGGMAARRCSLLLSFSAGFLVPRLSGALAASLPIEKIQLPPGFSISVYTDQVKGARSMTLGEKGTIFVGTRDAGRGAVYAVIPGPD